MADGDRPDDYAELEPMVAVDALDILAATYEPPAFIVEHLVTCGGVTLVSADTGAGKTAFVLNLAFAVALKERVAGRFAVDVDAGPVLYLNGELPEGLLREYVHQAAAVHDDRPPRGSIRFEGRHGVAEFRFDDAGRSRLADLVAEIRPSIIVFDTQRALFDIDENDAGDVRRMFAFIRSLCTKHECAAVIAHHLRKIGPISNSDRERVSGSRDIIAGVDIHLALRSRDGRPFHALAIGKTRAPRDGVKAGTEWPIDARLEGGNPPASIIIAGEATSRELIAEKTADAEADLLDRLEAEGPLTLEAAGARSGSTKRAYDSLRKAGTIAVVGKDGKKTLIGIVGLHDQLPLNGVSPDPDDDPGGGKRHNHAGLNGVTPDPAPDPAGRNVGEEVSPPLSSGDHLSTSSNERGHGVTIYRDPDPDPVRKNSAEESEMPPTPRSTSTLAGTP
jgi:hypothetical protein